MAGKKARSFARNDLELILIKTIKLLIYKYKLNG